jgi:hypothetical protein
MSEAFGSASTRGFGPAFSRPAETHAQELTSPASQRISWRRWRQGADCRHHERVSCARRPRDRGGVRSGVQIGRRPRGDGSRSAGGPAAAAAARWLGPIDAPDGSRGRPGPRRFIRRRLSAGRIVGGITDSRKDPENELVESNRAIGATGVAGRGLGCAQATLSGASGRILFFSLAGIRRWGSRNRSARRAGLRIDGVRPGRGDDRQPNVDRHRAHRVCAGSPQCCRPSLRGRGAIVARPVARLITAPNTSCFASRRACELGWRRAVPGWARRADRGQCRFRWQSRARPTGDRIA